LAYASQCDTFLGLPLAGGIVVVILVILVPVVIIAFVVSYIIKRRRAAQAGDSAYAYRPMADGVVARPVVQRPVMRANFTGRGYQSSRPKSEGSRRDRGPGGGLDAPLVPGGAQSDPLVLLDPSGTPRVVGVGVPGTAAQSVVLAPPSPAGSRPVSQALPPPPAPLYVPPRLASPAVASSQVALDSPQPGGGFMLPVPTGEDDKF